MVLKSCTTKYRLFNVFNAVALFLLVNFCIYRYFLVPKSNINPAVNTDVDQQHQHLETGINAVVRQATIPSDGNVNNKNDKNNVVDSNNKVMTENKNNVVQGKDNIHDDNNNDVSNNNHKVNISATTSNSKLKQSSLNKTISSTSLSSSSSKTGTANKDTNGGGNNDNINNNIETTVLQKKPEATDNKGDDPPSVPKDGSVTSSDDLPLCPLVPPNLNGPLATYSHAITFQKIGEANPALQKGGRFKPANCVARHRVAIVIPYRNREEHLQILLNNLHPMLMRQQLDYGIYIIDQAPPTRFNRAMLMNIGYAEAMKRYDYQCAIFHDVDLLPENDKNIYSCPEMPRHLSAAIDKFRYRLPYAGIYGGVSAVKKEQFEKMNGFSNMFFGWGGEDDDMAKRISLSGFKITRYPMDIARYRMIKHTKDKGNESNPQRFSLLRSTKQRMKTDGLNSLKYKVQTVDEQPTHTRIEVYIDQDEIMKEA